MGLDGPIAHVIKESGFLIGTIDPEPQVSITPFGLDCCFKYELFTPERSSIHFLDQVTVIPGVFHLPVEADAFVSPACSV